MASIRHATEGPVTQQQLHLDEPHRAPEDTPEIPFAVALLALSGIKGLGSRGIRNLCQAVEGNLAGLWHLEAPSLRTVLSAAKVSSPDLVQREILQAGGTLLIRGATEQLRLAARSIHVVGPGELPLQLRAIPGRPWWLFVEGNPAALHTRPAVAVVGTRQPSSQGVKATGTVARTLAAYPITLISGLAEGIDAEAHRASLQDGVRNVAFLGHGIDLIFPASTEHLRRQIVADGGAVATEYLPYEHYQKHYFVERNRLQAALADIVIPVQGKVSGGTAHTLRFALEFGRSVLGIRCPGENGIVADIEKKGGRVIDVFTADGRRELDGMLRQLAEDAGQETFALALFEKRLRAEIQGRDIRISDVAKLSAALQVMAQELNGARNP